MIKPLNVTPEMLEQIRKEYITTIAEELCRVQPIDPKPFCDLYKFLKDNPGKALVFRARKSDED